MAKVQPQAKTQTLPRVDPDEDFSDVDGDPRTEFALAPDTEDPTRHYHWAHNTPDDIGSYVGGVLGYRVERISDGGVKPQMGYGLTVGDAITKRDHVLISCDKEKWDKLERYNKKKNAEQRARMFKSAQRTIRVESRE